MKSINLTPEYAKKISGYVDSFDKTYNGAISLKENEINFILKNCPQLTGNEAGEIVDGIHNGCVLYNAELEKALEGEKSSIKTVFAERLSEAGVEERYAIASAMLMVVQAVNEEAVAQFSENKGSDIRKTVEELLSAEDGLKVNEGSVGEEELEELLTVLDEAIDSTPIGYYGCEGIKKLVESDIEAEGINFVEDYLKNEQLKTVNAVVTYIAYRNGELDCVEEKVFPEELAVMVCAGMDSHSTMVGLGAGCVPEDAASKVYKAIGKAVIVCLCTYVLYKLMLVGFAIGMASFAVFFSSQIIVTVLSLIYGIVFGVTSAAALLKLLEKIGVMGVTVFVVAKIKISEAYKKISSIITEKVVPAVKEKAEKIRDFITEKVVPYLKNVAKAIFGKLAPGK